jgi:4-amino-4-deoxy-L-arabinose transferase-like glycosyltransferase
MSLQERPASDRSTLLLAGVIVLALVLRFWRLGDWNFQATEMFTLRDSLTPKLTNPRPLSYFLTHYLVGSFRSLDEFGLRLLPAIFGVLAVPVVYLVFRRVAGDRAAMISALLVAVSPLQILYSQLARYWSLVFLLSAIYPYAIYLGLRERSRSWLVVGCMTGVLAVLAHPVSVLLLGGIVLYLVASVRRDEVARLWAQKSVRWTVLLATAIAAVILVRFVPLLQGWISMHDSNPGSGQFLRPAKPAPGLKQIIYLSNYVESLTVPLVLSAIAGIYWLWRGPDRSLARFLTSLAVFHIGFLTLLSLRTSVGQYYLLPSAPVFYLSAGIFIDQLFRIETPWRARWLLPTMMIAIIIAASAPTLISDARDGRRYDFRSSAHWIATRVAPTDIVFSDQPMVTAHYLPQHPVRHLRQDVGLLKTAMDGLREAGRGGALWIVAPAPSHAHRPNMKQGGMISWIYDNCQLRHSTGVGRIDFRQNYLHIYHCPSAKPGPDSLGR